MSSSTYGTKNSYLLGEPIGAAQQDIVLDTLGRLAGCEQPSLPTFGIFGVHQLHEAIDLHSARVSGALGLMKNCQYAYISQSPSRSIGGTSAGRKPTPSHAKPWNRSWCNIERRDIRIPALHHTNQRRSQTKRRPPTHQPVATAMTLARPSASRSSIMSCARAFMRNVCESRGFDDLPAPSMSGATMP